MFLFQNIPQLVIFSGQVSSINLWKNPATEPQISTSTHMCCNKKKNWKHNKLVPISMCEMFVAELFRNGD